MMEEGKEGKEGKEKEMSLSGFASSAENGCVNRHRELGVGGSWLGGMPMPPGRHEQPGGVAMLAGGGECDSPLAGVPVHIPARGFAAVELT